jgi:hypothetical protein
MTTGQLLAALPIGCGSEVNLGAVRSAVGKITCHAKVGLELPVRSLIGARIVGGGRH